MGTLSFAGFREGSGRVPKISSVLFFGVAVKCNEGDALVVSPRGHLSRENVFGTDLAAVVQIGQFLGCEHLFQCGRRLTRLRTMRLVGDHRETFALRR